MRLEVELTTLRLQAPYSDGMGGDTILNPYIPYPRRLRRPLDLSTYGASPLDTGHLRH